MATTYPLKLYYVEEKDILQLQIPPARAAKWQGNRYNFFVLVNWHNKDEIVGFEIMDFGNLFIPHLYDPAAIPAEVLDMRFNVDGGPQGADIRDVLEWAYRRFVTKRDLSQVPMR
jgi:hypothetical protein